MLRSFFTLIVLFTAASLRGEENGNEALFKALGRTDCTVVPLWPERKGPGETRPELADEARTNDDGVLLFRPVVRAEMIVVPPAAGTRSTGACVLVCPGGGYGALETVSITQGARWLNAMGATAVLLKYRVPRRNAGDPPYHLPLMDSQRAMGLLRSRAAEWKLDPHKIGIAGFSAGGHLAAMTSNHHAKRTYERVDAHDDISCRPDFCLLVYPAYLTKPIDSATLDPALEPEKISPERTPPTFITVVRPDKFTVGCAAYMNALNKAKVPSELHVFASGGHGGCFDRYPLIGWGYESTRFLKDHGVLDAEAAAAGEEWLKGQERTVLADLPALPDSAGAAKKAPRVPEASSKASSDNGLGERDLSIGDVELKKLAGSNSMILELWPGGTRSDDPLAKDGPTAETLPTKPGDKPGEVLRITDITRPSLVMMRPAKPDGRAVIVIPGGGFRRLAIEHEGIDPARWLTEGGITAFVLKYRAPAREGVPASLQDVQRAVSLVRSRAAELGIDPEWVGVMGFSAGGYLAAEVCHRLDERTYEPADEHDRASCRPNFGMLMYPGGLIDEQGKLLAEFGNAQRNRTPPLFVTVAADDKLTEGILKYVPAVREGRVPVALHVYEKGGHGQGLRASAYPFSRWTFAADRWLADLMMGKD
jgi:acetyl esterase/lipase